MLKQMESCYLKWCQKLAYAYMKMHHLTKVKLLRAIAQQMHQPAIHHPYSPDLSLWDFFFFPRLKKICYLVDILARKSVR